MADADFEMQRHDRLPVIQATLNANLTAAASVTFIMRKASADYVPDFTGGTKVDAAATVVDAAGGVVEYPWLAVDTDTAGYYVGQWEVIWPGALPETFPTKTYNTILIRADLDDA